MPISYDKNSIVDTLKSQGKASDFASRSTLAKTYGITNYTGSSDQNKLLLSKVSPITSNIGYADSISKAGQFNESSNFINNRTNLDTVTNPNANGTTTDTTKIKEPTIKSVEDKAKGIQNDEQVKIDKWEADQKDQITRMYQSNLALVDSKYASAVASIGNSFDERIKTLKKLNTLQLDRTKAYGMSTAQYMPIEYTDAITKKEKDQADEVASLEQQREALLQEAKYNMEQGKVDALKGNQEAINSLEKTLTTKVQNVLKNYDEQRKIVNDMYEAEKKSYLEDMKKRAVNAISLFGDEWEKAKTNEERDKIVQKALSKYGDPTSPNELTMFKQEFMNNYKTKLDVKKDELALQKTENTINNTSSGKKLTATEKKANKDNAISNAYLVLKNQKEKNNWKGIDPTQYKQTVQLIKDEYGASAVMDFDKMLKDNNVRVDYGNTK